MVATAEQTVVRRNDGSAKIDNAILRKAKIVAAHKDVPLAEYLSGILEAIVDGDFERYSREALAEAEAKKRARRKPKGSDASEGK